MATETTYLVHDSASGVIRRGTFDECAIAMDSAIAEAVALYGSRVVLNEGVGFRLPDGTRRTYLRAAGEEDRGIARVLEVRQA